LDVGDIGNNNVISKQDEWARNSYRGDQDNTEVEAVSKSAVALLYKRTSKERKKDNPPTANNLSLYTVHLLPSNHSPCSDVPSKSFAMIFHTVNLIPYQQNHATSTDVATPGTTIFSLQIIPPPPHHILLLFPHLSTSPAFSKTNPFSNVS